MTSLCSKTLQAGSIAVPGERDEAGFRGCAGQLFGAAIGRGRPACRSKRGKRANSGKRQDDRAGGEGHRALHRLIMAGAG